MILLDYWPLKRFELKKDDLVLWQLKEKIPFFFLSVVVSVITLYSSVIILYDSYNPHHPPVRNYYLSSRIANAFVSFMTYLEKTFYPHDMSVFYPFPDLIPIWQVLSATLLIIVITTVVIAMVKRLPYLFIGWLWYTITILPVIGIIQIGNYSMADRYHYLPSIGIAVMLAWGIPLLFPSKDMHKKILFLAGIAALVIMAVLTWKQCGYWKNSATLFSHSLQVTKNNHLAHNSFGLVLFEEGKIEDAIYHFNQAIRIMPNFARGYNNRGIAYLSQGNNELGCPDVQKACSLGYCNVLELAKRKGDCH
jgi:tetratricopeptide (TPR) repeat protein